MKGLWELGGTSDTICAGGRSCVYFVVSLLPLELLLRQISTSEEAERGKRSAAFLSQKTLE